MGLARKEDLNQLDQEGIGYYSHNIKDGRRQSAAVAFLDPISNRRNLHIVTDIHVDRVLFESRRATGVKGRLGGKEVVFEANNEIILSAGTVNSPSVQLSGIGPASLLQSLGIEVIHDSPDVGGRLLEHLGFSSTYRLKGNRGTNHHFYGLGLAGSILRYLTTRTGPMATGPLEIGAFARTNPDEADAKSSVVCRRLDAGGSGRLERTSADASRRSVSGHDGVRAAGTPGKRRQHSNYVLGSGCAACDLANWLSTRKDQRSAIEMIHYLRRLVAQPALAQFVAEEMVPGAGVESDEDILRQSGASRSAGRTPCEAAVWAVTRSRWSMNDFECAAYMACESSTARSCRDTFPAIPTHQRWRRVGARRTSFSKMRAGSSLCDIRTIHYLTQRTWQ